MPSARSWRAARARSRASLSENVYAAPKPVPALAAVALEAQQPALAAGLAHFFFFSSASVIAAWDRPRIRCHERAIAPGIRHTHGSGSTASSCSTPGRCSSTSSRTSGSTSAASATTSCATTASTTSRTAARATLVQQQYAIRNPRGFEKLRRVLLGHYRERRPWPARAIDGVERAFYDYVARGVPDGPDDGTLAPWAVVASLPFAPEIVLPTIAHYERVQLAGRRTVWLQGDVQPDLPGERDTPSAGCRPITSASTRARPC